MLQALSSPTPREDLALFRQVLSREPVVQRGGRNAALSLRQLREPGLARRVRTGDVAVARRQASRRDGLRDQVVAAKQVPSSVHLRGNR